MTAAQQQTIERFNKTYGRNDVVRILRDPATSEVESAPVTAMFRFLEIFFELLPDGKITNSETKAERQRRGGWIPPAEETVDPDHRTGDRGPAVQQEESPAV